MVKMNSIFPLQEKIFVRMYPKTTEERMKQANRIAWASGVSIFFSLYTLFKNASTSNDCNSANYPKIEDIQCEEGHPDIPQRFGNHS